MVRVAKPVQVACAGVVITLLVAACMSSADDASGARSASTKAAEAPNVFRGPLAKAQCGPGSKPEVGMQGRTRAVEDVASGRAELGYQCNMELVGHEGDGAEWQMAWYEDCAYYALGASFASGTTATAGGTRIAGGGVAVDDVTDPANPVRTATLLTPAMIDPWESLKVNEKRGLLAGASLSIEGPAVFDVYDLTQADPAAGTPAAGQLGGCAHPVLQSSIPVDAVGHEGEWAPDGRTYYGSGFLVPVTTAIDVSVPQAPHVVATIQEGIHGMSVSDTGNRIYAAKMGGFVGNAGNNANTGANGLEIWDVSQINARAPDAVLGQLNPIIVGSLYWDDGAVAQMTIPVTIQGKKYVIFIDEGGGVCCGIPDQTPGMARIIDINDETHPFIVSYLRDEIDMTENAEARKADGGASGFTYQGHYCGVPQREEPGVVACSYFWQGIRLFDIRDPYHPKEIAYYVPGNRNAEAGATPAASGGCPVKVPGVACTSSMVRLIPERGEIWFTTQGDGLIVAKVTNDVWPFKAAAATPPPAVPVVAAAPPPPSTGRFGGAMGLAFLPLMLLGLMRRRPTPKV